MSGHCLVLHYLRVGAYVTSTQSDTHTMQQTHIHKGVTRCIEGKKKKKRREKEKKKTLPWQRQSDYRLDTPKYRVKQLIGPI